MRKANNTTNDAVEEGIPTKVYDSLLTYINLWLDEEEEMSDLDTESVSELMKDLIVKGDAKLPGLFQGMNIDEDTNGYLTCTLNIKFGSLGYYTVYVCSDVNDYFETAKGFLDYMLYLWGICKALRKEVEKPNMENDLGFINV